MLDVLRDPRRNSHFLAAAIPSKVIAGLDLRRARCAAATLLMGTLGYITPLHAEPPLQDLKPRHEILLNELESVRWVLAGADGGSYAVGAFAAPADGNGGVLIALDAQLREQKRTPIAKPKPSAAGDAVRRNVVEGAAALAGGDILVFGNVEIGPAGGTARREGWAVRIGRDGAERWNRYWPGPAATREEYLYFARPMPGGAYLLGGKRQASSNCNDASSGVAFEIDVASGAMRGERRLYTGGATRQGFRDAAVQTDGSTTFAGWIGGEGAAERCRDDAWMLTVAAGKTEGRSRRVRGAEADTLFAHAGEIGGAAVFSGFISASRAGATDGLIAAVPAIGDAMERRAVAPLAGGRARLEASARLASGRLNASLGHMAASAAANAGESGWLRLHGAAPLCGHDVRIAASVDTRLLAADMTTAGGAERIVVAGSARKAGARATAGWIGAADLATTVGDLGALDVASGARALLAATTAAAPSGSARATVKFSLPAAALVRIVADPLTRADIMLAMRSERGKSLWLSDLPWSGTEVIERQLPAGAYVLEIVSPEPGAILSVSAGVRRAAEPLPALEVEALRPLIGDALDTIGIGSDTGGGGNGRELTQIVAALEANQCRDGKAIDGLRALFVAAAERAAALGKEAARTWLDASRSPAVVTRELVAAASDGEADSDADAAAADDAPVIGSIRYLEVPGHDRILGEIRRGDGYDYKGELAIPLADRHNRRIALKPSLIEGHGVKHTSEGIVLAGRFADSRSVGGVEVRFKTEEAFLGLLVHTQQAVGKFDTRPLFGAGISPDGKLELIGSAALARSPCPPGSARSSGSTELLCEPIRTSAFPAGHGRAAPALAPGDAEDTGPGNDVPDGGGAEDGSENAPGADAPQR